MIINSNKKSNNISLKAGLTPRLEKSIKNANINDISDKFIRNNINVDFKDNKIIAWCCDKVFDTIRFFNQNYGLNFGFPQGILVEDFSKIKVHNNDRMFGFCNLMPSKVYKEKEQVIPQKTLFFNMFDTYNKSQVNDREKIYWENINKLSDLNYVVGFSPTDYFLDLFFHEFAHSIHLDNLLKNKNIKDVYSSLLNIRKEDYIKSFQGKWKSILSQMLCPYAGQNPLDAVACDISKRFCYSINSGENYFDNDIYRHNSGSKNIFNRNSVSSTEELLKNLYNGNF